MVHDEAATCQGMVGGAVGASSHVSWVIGKVESGYLVRTCKWGCSPLSEMKHQEGADARKT